MPKYIRRSLFPLFIDDPKLEEKAFDSWADAIILDFHKKPDQDWQKEIKSRMYHAVSQASKGAADVFVRINNDASIAELESTVVPGIAGVVIKGVMDSDDVKKVSDYLELLEVERGITKGSLEIDVEVNTASAVWNSLEIARISPRFGTFMTDEIVLSQNLGMSTQPNLDFEPLEYIKSQLITVATSVGGQTQGISYPLSLTQKDTDEEELKKAVKRARDTGFKGAICPHVSWTKVCNEGFRPSPEEIVYYRKVREVFAEGLKRGLASVPLDGKMIDIPVDVRAQVYLEWADRAAIRDEEKAKAHQV